MAVLQWLAILAISRFSLLHIITPGVSWCEKLFQYSNCFLRRDSQKWNY